MAGSVVDALDAALRSQADPVRAEQNRAYLRSNLVHWGLPVPVVRAHARRAAALLDRAGLLAVAQALWDEPPEALVHERRLAAAELLAARTDLLDSQDAPLLGDLITKARTWALVDVLAPNVAGPLVERDPAGWQGTLAAWTADPDVWRRRAAVLVHLVPLRRGGGDWERFSGTADALLDDREFFVRKAIGWVLRDTSRRRPALVAAWVEPRATAMSGVTFREAVRRLPAPDRDRLTSLRTTDAPAPPRR